MVRKIRYPRVEEDLCSAVRQEAEPAQQQWAAGQRPQARPHTPDTSREGGSAFASPAQLVRYMKSGAAHSAQQQYWDRLRATYEILESSPWIEPRTMSLLALVDATGESYTTYTMRTAVRRPRVEAEITKLLGGKRRPGGESVVDSWQLRDGVLAFEDSDDAERFAQQLEADGAGQILVADVDSHDFFMQLQAAGAVLVYLKKGPGLPSHTDLATSLRQKGQPDDLI